MQFFYHLKEAFHNVIVHPLLALSFLPYIGPVFINLHDITHDYTKPDGNAAKIISIMNAPTRLSSLERFHRLVSLVGESHAVNYMLITEDPGFATIVSSNSVDNELPPKIKKLDEARLQLFGDPSFTNIPEQLKNI